jgi:hypothetical protein
MKKIDLFKFENLNKRGQMEIIGLMVIVLLLLFGLLFYFKFANTEDTDIIGEAEQNLEVSNMLSAIKLYTIEDGVDMKDLLKDCVSGDSSDCDTANQLIPEIIEAYGWTEDQYMYYIDENEYGNTECLGFSDDFSVSGAEIGLIYCMY